MASLPVRRSDRKERTETASALTRHGRLPPLPSKVNWLSRLPLLSPVLPIARSRHGGYELAAAGFGHCGGRSVWPPPGHSAWTRGLSLAWLSEASRWVLALGESALRGSGVRDRGLFQGDLGGTWREPAETAGWV